MRAKAIQNLKPKAQWILHKDKLEWLDKVQTEPTQAEIDLKVLELEAQEIIEAQQEAFNNGIQNHLDTQAQALRYDNINAIGKYVGYVNAFQVEAEALGAWASSCWKVAGQIEADVQAGVRPMPTVDEVLAELPVYGG